MDDQIQELRYRLTLDRTDVWSAVDDVEKAAQRIASSVSGLSANLVGNAMAANMPGGMPAAGSALSPAMNAVWLAQQQRLSMPSMNPYAAVAQDAYQQQIMAAGASPLGGFGPSLTTPMGTATVNLFRPPAAGPFNLPIDYLRQFGPTGAPGDPGRSHLAYGTGAGSLFDMARMSLGMRMFGRISNNNLEDRMFHNLERRRESFAENVRDVRRFLTYELGPELGGAALGGMIGTAFGGPGVGAFVGGTIGGLGGMAVNATLGAVARPYENMSREFQQYTAPFIRGDRVGGGLDLRGRLGAMRDIARSVSGDSFFTSREYQDFIRVAGETGQFQFTGSTQQALDAVRNVRESVATLLKVGVAARDSMKTIDTLLNNMGISGQNPRMFANAMQNMAISAQSAGVSTAQMVQMAAPAAQLFMSQGIGPATGAQIYALNAAGAQAMFRGGTVGAVDNAYFGGAQGLAQSLTQGTAAMLRTPLGQTVMSGMFAPGGDLLRRMMQGGSVSFQDAMGAAGRQAQDPFMFGFKRLAQPWLTQQLGSQLQSGMDDFSLGVFKDMFPNFVDPNGKVSPEHYVMFGQTAWGWTDDQTMAQYRKIQGGATQAMDIRRSARDAMAMDRMENLRGPTLGRRLKKWWVDVAGVPATNLMADLGESSADFADSAMNSLLGIHRYKTGDLGRLTGQPLMMQMYYQQNNETLEGGGLGSGGALVPVSAGGSRADYRGAQEATLRRIANDPALEAQYLDLARRGGMTAEGAQSALDAIRRGGRPADMAAVNRLTDVTGATLNTGLASAIRDYQDRNSSFRGSVTQAINASFAPEDREAARRAMMADEGYFRGRRVDPAVTQQALALGQDIVQREQAYQRENLDTLSGLRAFREGNKGARGTGAADAAMLIDAMGGRQNAIQRLIETQDKYGPDGFQQKKERQTFENVAQSLFGKSLDQLNPTERARIGTALSSMSNRQAYWDTVNTGSIAAGVAGFGLGAATAAGVASPLLLGGPLGWLGYGASIVGGGLAGAAGMFGIGHGLGRAVQDAGLSGKERTLAHLADEGDKAMLDASQMSLEGLDKERQKAIGGMANELRGALKHGTAQEQMLNSQLVARMAVTKILGTASTPGQVQARLRQAGITGDKLEQLGINLDDFQADPGKYALGYHQKLQAEISKATGGQRDALMEAQQYIYSRSNMGDITKALQGAGTLTGIQERFAQASAVSVLPESQPRIMDAMRGVKLDAGQDMATLIKGVGGVDGRDISGTRAFFQVLKRSTQAQGQLGLSAGMAGTVADLAGQVERGDAIGQEQVERLIAQLHPGYAASEDGRAEIKRYAKGLVGKYQEGVSAGGAKKAEQQDAMGLLVTQAGVSALSQGEQGAEIGGGSLGGGILGPDATSGIQQAARDQLKAAQQIEKFASNFSKASLDTFASQVGSLKDSIDKGDGLTTSVQALNQKLEAIINASSSGGVSVKVTNLSEIKRGLLGHQNMPT